MTLFRSILRHRTQRLAKRISTGMGEKLFPIGVTSRLRIGQFEDCDANDRYAYHAEEDVARYLYRPPLSREACQAGTVEAAQSTSLAADGDTLLFAVRAHDSRRVIGEVVLKLASRTANQFEIGWVFNPEFGGQGYAAEAASAVASYAFSIEGAHRLFARLDTENFRSVRLCERLGFRREAHLIDNDKHPSAAWGSEYIYAALQPDLITTDGIWQ